MNHEVNINSIGQVAIAITHYDDSLHFYHNVLGLELLFEAQHGLAFLQCGDIRLMLTTLQGDQSDHRTSVIYYKVDDLEQTVALLKNQKVAIEQEAQHVASMKDHELWVAFIRDPDDNLIGLMAEYPLTPD